MFTCNIKKTKRGSLNFIIIVMILIPVILLPMTKILINSFQVQNNLTEIASETNEANSIIEIALYESLEYIDGLALSEFSSTELKNKISNKLTTSLGNSDVSVLVNDSIENGKLHLNLIIDNETTVILEIESIELEAVYTYQGIEIEGSIEGEEDYIITDYLIDITKYIERRWIK